MQTLSYGVKKPDSGDKGRIVFDAFEDNIDHYIAHTHDGSDSAQIDQLSISRQSSTLLAASWAASGGGYKQTVTCPGSITLDAVGLRFRVRSGALQHHFIHPTVVPLSLTQFEVHVNDSSLELECLYL